MSTAEERRQAKRKSRAAHPEWRERARIYQREWRQQHPEEQRAYNAEYYQRVTQHKRRGRVGD